jgi:tRNA/rRNA methyltransferase
MRTRFILIQTSHAGNVGAAARAMKTMGFDDLVLVAPRWANVLRREETIQRASGALDVLTNARIVDTLDEALDGVTHLCATAMIPRDFGPPTRTPREHLEPLAKAGRPARRLPVRLRAFRHAQRGRLPLQRGAEHPDRPEIRLAEPGRGHPGDRLRMAAGARRLRGARRHGPRAGGRCAKAVAGMLDHWERSLVDIGFLDPAAPKKLMPRLQQLFNRAQPTPEEIHILRGIAKAMTDAAKGPKGRKS